MESNLNDQEIVRRKKSEVLKSKGIDPFGSSYKRTYDSKKIHEDFDKYNKEELDAKENTVSIAGRIMSKRRMGNSG